MLILIIVGVVAGWAVGLFASGNILLPLFWAWPKARRLAREGTLQRPIPPPRFLVAPIIWSLLLGTSLVLVATFLTGMLYAYIAGLAVGFGQTQRLLNSPNQDMEEDFARTYGAFLKERTELAAVTKITANLFEQPLREQSDAPKVLQWTLSDSRFRYLMFCLSTVHVICAHRMRDSNAVLREAAQHAIDGAMAYEGSDGFFSGPINRETVTADGMAHLREFLDRWGAWIDATRADPGNARAGTSIVCSMLQRVESNGSGGDGDNRRIWPLAVWVEDTIPAIDKAFVQLNS